MLNKENKIIFVLLIANFFLFFLFFCGIHFQTKKQKLNSVELVFLPGRAEISEIYLSQGNESLVIKKADGNWRGQISGMDFLIDKNIADGFISLLSTPHYGNILSSSLTQKHRYGLNNENAFNVKILSENSTIISDLNFGFVDALGDAISYYSGIDNHIYSIDNKIFFYLTLKTNYWCELDLFAQGLDINKLQGFTFESDNSVGSGIFLDLSRIKNEDWNLVYKNNVFVTKKVKDSDLKEYFNRLSMLRALDAAGVSISAITKKYKLSFTWGDGTSTNFEIFENINTDEKILYSDSTDTYYIISAYTLERIIPDFIQDSIVQR